MLGGKDRWGLSWRLAVTPLRRGGGKVFPSGRVDGEVMMWGWLKKTAKDCVVW